MRESQLLSPGSYGHGQRLRKETANAISAAEISSQYAGAPSATAIALAAFLADAAAQTPGYVTPPPDLEATEAIVATGTTVPVQNSAGAAIGTGTRTVAANAVTNVRLPATIAGVSNSATVQILPASGTSTANPGTAAVAAGVITGVRLPATKAVVATGQTIAVTGGTVTLTVAANVVTAEFTAA